MSTPVSEWLASLPQQDGISLISDDLPYDHPEQDYDLQYGSEAIEESIGPFVLDAAGFIPNALLEVACGTGHMTASLLFDGRVKEIVASDASAAFLNITRKKVAKLGGATGLVRLTDNDFDRIPEGVFDAIVMRSALHHFTDFKAVASTLLGKIQQGGGLFLLEPRADFHIAIGLILMNVQAKAPRVWTERHEEQTQRVIDAASFYLDRTLDKEGAEDKHVFLVEDFVEIAKENGATLSILGGEYPGSFSRYFHEFIKHCERFDPDVIRTVMAVAAEELAFVDKAFAPRPRYASAEWFLLRK
jgi:SAM-dependent methyltransferase